MKTTKVILLFVVGVLAPAFGQTLGTYALRLRFNMPGVDIPRAETVLQAFAATNAIAAAQGLPMRYENVSVSAQYFEATLLVVGISQSSQLEDIWRSAFAAGGPIELRSITWSSGTAGTGGTGGTGTGGSGTGGGTGQTVIPTITAQPSNQTVSAGGTVTLSVTAGGTATPTYQWRRDGAAISGATNASLTLSNVTSANAGTYTVVITNSAGSVTSGSAVVTVTGSTASFRFTSQPQSTIVPANGMIDIQFYGAITGSVSQLRFDVTLNGTAVMTNGVWSESFLSGRTDPWVIRFGDGAANPFGWGIPNARDSDSGTWIITVTPTGGSPVLSAPFTITVRAATTGAPTISSQPLSRSVTAGGSVTFSVTASGSPAPIYQWRRDGTAIPGATGAALAMNNVTSANAGSYTVVVSNSAGSITSNAAVLTVSASTAGGNTAPRILYQPSGATATVGGTAALSVVASGDPAPSYQWRRNGAPLNGATSSSLLLSSISAASEGSYTVVVSNAAGSVTSTAAAVSVAAAAPTYVRYLYDSFSLNSAEGRVGGANLHGRSAEWGIAGRPVWTSADLYQGGSNTFAANGSNGFIRPSSGASSTLATLPLTLTPGPTYYLRAKVYPSGVGELPNRSNPTQAFLSLGFYKRQSGNYIWNDTRVVDFVMFRANYTLSLATRDLIGTTSGPWVLPGYPGGTPAWSTSSPASVEVVWDTMANTLTARINGTTIINAQSLAGMGVRAEDVRAIGFGRDFYMDAGGLVDDFEFGEVLSPAAAAGRLSNLAIRTTAGTGAEMLIMGFTVGGANTQGAKSMLIRGAGPSLGAFGLTGVLDNPQLALFRGASEIARNDNWNGDAQVASEGTRLGAFPFMSPGSGDAALVTSQAGGGYTVQVSGVGGTSGIALAEVYDATTIPAITASTPRLTNVSARTRVGTGGDILIAGFTVAGVTSRTMLLRAVGPSLAAFGVAGALADPQLALFRGETRLSENDDWGGSPVLTGAFATVGAFSIANTSRDAAILITLPPGSYTAQVTGANETTGIALVEVYELP